MSQPSLQPAFVLHHRPYRNSSVIADLLTPENGRISVVARGVRTSKSSRRALLQPFRPLLAAWVGRSELKTLTKLEDSGRALELQGDALAYAYYVSELSLRLIAIGEPNVHAFAAYTRTLNNLASGVTDADALQLETHLRLFELDLLHSLGVLPDFAHSDSNHGAIKADAQYLFLPQLGIATIARDTAIPNAEQVAISGATLLAMHRRDFSVDNQLDSAMLLEAKRLMRQLLRIHLGDQPLKSREVFKQLRSRASSQHQE